MKYSGFILKNTEPKPYIKNKLQSKEKNNEVIYRAEYPVLLKKKELIKPKTKHKMTLPDTQNSRIVEEPLAEVDETLQNVVETRENGGFTRVLCGVLASVLCFTAVYLSGVKPPEYVQRGVLALVEYAKNNDKLNIQASAKENNTKIIGGKEFVKADAVDDSGVNINSVVGVSDENSKFAESIMESGTENINVQTDVSVMSEQDEDANEKTVQVIARNMSKGSDKIYVTNRTELQLDFNKILLREYPIDKYPVGAVVNDEPLVLIVHTHGTEAYINSTENNVTRSTDTEKNVVRIGTELTKVLESYGIPVIHSKTMHDEVSYIKAYDNSKAEVAKYLAQYPSIKYVIDLHRDALGSDGEIPVKTFTSVNGESSAQLMFVMGTNAAGGNHPNYMNNLTVAANLQNVANELYPGLMRPINVRPIIFNQNLADGCMILEVGSDANTIEEALAAVRMFGRCFAQTVCG